MRSSFPGHAWWRTAIIAVLLCTGMTVLFFRYVFDVRLPWPYLLQAILVSAVAFGLVLALAFQRLSPDLPATFGQGIFVGLLLLPVGCGAGVLSYPLLFNDLLLRVEFWEPVKEAPQPLVELLSTDGDSGEDILYGRTADRALYRFEAWGDTWEQVQALPAHARPAGPPRGWQWRPRAPGPIVGESVLQVPCHEGWCGQHHFALLADGQVWL